MTAPGVLAVCPRSLGDHEGFAAAVADAGWTVRWNRTGRRLIGSDLHDFLDGADAAVVGLERPDVARLPRLKTVAKYGVGLDSLDLDALEAAGVAVGWTPGLNRHAVAELTIGLMLAAFRGIRAARPHLESGVLGSGAWRPPLGRELRGARVAVVGCGHAGLEVVRRLLAFGADVRVHDLRDRRAYLPAGASQVGSLTEVLDGADVVTLHVPLDGTTRDLLDACAIARLGPGAVVVNAARGGLVDEAALLAALDSGVLSAAALDVVVDEPIVPGPLLSHPAVVLTPHVGGTTRASVDRMAAAAFSNLTAAEPVSALRARLAAGEIVPE